MIVERPYSQIIGKLKRPDGVDETKTWDVKPDVVYDVPRVPANDPDGRPEGTAIIADPRNDQTEIILQLHVAMQKFHNKLVDTLRASGTPRSAVFEAARRLARWHYQWIVTHEFIPAIVGQTMSDLVYKEVPTGAPKITLKYYKPTNPAGAPSSRSSSRWPRTASATASPGPATPSGTSSTALAPSLDLSLACRCSRTRPPTTT